MSARIWTRSLRTIRPRVNRPAQPVHASSGRWVAAARPLSTTMAFRHKESEIDDPDFNVDKLTEESIHEQKEGKGQWIPGLASDSEELVKADRLTNAEAEREMELSEKKLKEAAQKQKQTGKA